ncbi:MAG: hypothetical protein GX561_07380 [Lentisphaerae bacterium]|jgi:hypothetical protein|nr:hypothetical protein [Lentisphaerota bacterium]
MNKHIFTLLTVAALLLGTTLTAQPRRGGPGRRDEDRRGPQQVQPARPGRPGPPAPPPRKPDKPEPPHPRPGKPGPPNVHRPGPPPPPPPHKYHRRAPHRHPKTKYRYHWYDYTLSRVHYTIDCYNIYECRNCHLVHYSPIAPAAEVCAALPGFYHTYQILGKYGPLAFQCTKCGVTVNCATVPAAGTCGAGYHTWVQLLQY